MKLTCKQAFPTSVCLEIILGTLGLLFSQLTLAQGGVLESIDTKTRSGYSTIQVKFTVPMQLISYEPTRMADLIVVRLRRVQPNTNSDFSSSERERLNWSPDSKVPLTEVTYEENGLAGPEMTLRLSRKINFELSAAADYRSIIVKVLDEAGTSAPEATTPKEVEGDRRDSLDSQFKDRIEQLKKNEVDSFAGKQYAINLQSTREKQEAIDIGSLLPGENLQSYVTSTEVKGALWYRQRLGFFASKAEADAIILRLKKRFPDAWVTNVPDREKAEALQLALPDTKPARLVTPKKQTITSKSPAPGKIAPPTKTGVKKKAVSEENVKSLLGEAEQRMLDKDYSTAVRLYEKILTYKDNAYTAQAQELLGLARERAGQVAHAIAEYRTYLDRYPQGDGAERVKQRLQGLTTARKTGQDKLRGSEKAEAAAQWDVFGSFSQYYRRDETRPDTGEAIVTQSSLATDFDVSGRLREKGYSLNSRLTVGHEANFLNNGRGNTERFIYAYGDADFTDDGFGVRLGRQSRSSSGVLGRFDGAHLSYQMNPRTKFNFIAGYPVQSTEDGIETARDFYSLSFDLGTYANAWDFNVFYVEQNVDSQIDRQAIGGEVRYFQPDHNFLSLLDYDVHFNDLNILLLIGNWTLPSQTSVHATLDYRKSPLLTTSNAIQGQVGIASVNSLQTVFTNSEIKGLAEDRTATSRTVNIGATHPLNNQYQIGGDLTLTSLNGTPASGGVAATPDTGIDYFANAQLIGSNLFKPGDISILGVRYSDTSTSHTTSLTLNTRYPVTSDFRVNPRVRLDYRKNLRDGSTQYIIGPFIRAEYRWKRKYHFEGELGGEYSNLRLTDTTDHTSSYYMRLGYRIDF